MEIKKQSLIDVIKLNKIIKIPYFQREYVWEEREINLLINDIIQYANNKNEYFIGPIIMQNKGSSKLLIDGQQRLTTFILILCALKELEPNLDKINEINALFDNISFESYNINDKKQLINIIKNNNQVNKDSKYFKNYMSIKNNLMDIKIDLNIFYNNLKNLICSFIIFENNINENVVFAKINSTGKRLTAFDMVKNQLLSIYSNYLNEQGAPYIDNEIELWNNHFNNINSKIKNGIDELIRTFLGYHTGKLYKSDTYILFDKFTLWLNNFLNINTIEDALKEVISFFLYYVYFDSHEYQLYNDSKYYDIIKPMIIISTDLKTYLILLIRVMREYSIINLSNESIEIQNYEKLYEALKIIEFYVICFKFTNLKTKIITRLIPTISIKLFTTDFNLSLYYLLVYKQWRIPYNDLLSTLSFNFFNNDMYINSSKFTKSFLLRFSYLNNPPNLIHDKLTIEHIMPQNLEEWITQGFQISEEDHRRYISVIGNLTLTNHNSKYSNYTFDLKLKHMFQNENNALSSYILQFKKWGVEEIKLRCKYIYDEVIKYWNFESMHKCAKELEDEDSINNSNDISYIHEYENEITYFLSQKSHFISEHIWSIESLPTYKKILRLYLVEGWSFEKIEELLFDKNYSGFIPSSIVNLFNKNKIVKGTMIEKDFEKYWDDELSNIQKKLDFVFNKN